MQKPTKNASGKQIKKTDEAVKQLILNRVNNNPATSADKFTNENLDQYNEKETILDMVSKMPFRKFISKKRNTYEKKFPPVYYDQLFRLCNLQRDTKNPSYKPWVFAILTLRIIYGRFPDGIIKYFEDENPADAEGFRCFKHFQLLNKLGEKRLLEFIDDAIRIMQKSNHWQHFWKLYGQEYGFTYQETLFAD